LLRLFQGSAFGIDAVTTISQHPARDWLILHPIQRLKQSKIARFRAALGGKRYILSTKKHRKSVKRDVVDCNINTKSWWFLTFDQKRNTSETASNVSR